MQVTLQHLFLSFYQTLPYIGLPILQRLKETIEQLADQFNLTSFHRLPLLCELSTLDIYHVYRTFKNIYSTQLNHADNLTQPRILLHSLHDVYFMYLSSSYMYQLNKAGHKHAFMTLHNAVHTMYIFYVYFMYFSPTSKNNLSSICALYK